MAKPSTAAMMGLLVIATSRESQDAVVPVHE
jgi:hypothetical protein